jgi:hypothetical protein
LERTGGFDRARVRGLVEALDKRHVLFEITYNVAEADTLGLTRETNAPSLASYRFNVSASSKTVNDFHQVIGRNPVSLSNLVDRDQPIVCEAQENEDAKCVVCEASEAHGALNRCIVLVSLRLRKQFRLSCCGARFGQQRSCEAVGGLNLVR